MEQTADIIGKTAGRHRSVERDETGECGREQQLVLYPLDHIAEAHAAGRRLTNPATHPHQIVVSRRLAVAQRRFVDREAVAPFLELSVAQPRVAKVFGAGDVQPDEIARVIHDAHLVGLGIIDPNPNLGDISRCSRRRLGHCLHVPAGVPIFGPVLGHRLVIFSDAHLGGKPPVVEETLLAFLDAVPTLGDCLLINGDLFDFWFAYSRVIPRLSFHVLAALARLRRQMPIVLVGGNRDRWGNDFWQRDLAITFAPLRTSFDIGQRRVLAVHGDGLTESRRRAVLLHRIINHPITAGVYRALHPEIGFWLVERLGPALSDRTQDERVLALAMKRQQAWAQQALEDDTSIGLVVMGHTHRAALATLSPGRQYLNPGAWFDGFRYAIATEADAELRCFSP